MEDHNEHEEQPQALPPVDEGHDTGESVLERLKRKRKQISASKTIDLDIPGYDGELVARYKRMSWDALKKIAEQAEASKSNRKELYGHADVLATACQELLLRKTKPGGESELVPLNDEYPDELGAQPVRFEPRLAAWLDLELEGTPSARKTVLAVFNNDLAVTAMHNELGSWMQSSKSEEDEVFTTS